MSRSPFLVLIAAAGISAAALPALAEGNRLLPFWAQSYPAGYVRYEPGSFAERRCRIARHVRTPHGIRTMVENRCRPVLHARD